MTLEELQALLQPSQADRDNALNMGLLQAGLGILANNTNKRNPMPALGAGGLMGLQGYQQSLDRSRQEGMQKLQTMQLLQKMQQQQQQEQQRIAVRNSLPESQRALFDLAPDKYMEKKLLADPKFAYHGGKIFNEGQLSPSGAPVEVGTIPQQAPWEYAQKPDGTYAMRPEVIQGKSAIAAAGRPTVETKVFNNTKDDFKNERDLRNDFAGLPTTKAFKEVQSAYDQISFALKNPSAANDLAAATKLMKLLDPGSVVRESELGMAMAATGKMDQLSNYVNMMRTGQKLTPSQRKDFANTAQGLYEAAASRYNDTATEYQGVANDYGLNASRVAKPAAIGSGGQLNSLQAMAAEELARRKGKK